MAKQSTASMNNQYNFVDNYQRAYTNNRVFFTFFSQKYFFQIKTLYNQCCFPQPQLFNFPGCLRYSSTFLFPTYLERSKETLLAEYCLRVMLFRISVPEIDREPQHQEERESRESRISISPSDPCICIRSQEAMFFKDIQHSVCPQRICV